MTSVSTTQIIARRSRLPLPVRHQDAWKIASARLREAPEDRRTRNDLEESAQMHRRIYQAIRDRDSMRARAEMARQLELAHQAQTREETQAVAPPSESMGSAS